jgi:putative membrane protein
MKPEAAPDQLKLAWDRTFLAHERTLMAWIRTAASLITFGFTLYKFFEFLRETDPSRHQPRVFGARTFGIVMIVVGIATLVLATWHHRQSMKLVRLYYPEARRSFALLVAGLISLLGVLALVAAAIEE